MTKILILSYYDNTGMGYALAEALRKFRNCEVTQVYWMKTYLDYPGQLYRPPAYVLRRLVKEADCVNLHDNAHTLLPEGSVPKRVVVTYHGTIYRQKKFYFDTCDALWGYRQTAVTLDLTGDGVDWLPRPMPTSLPFRVASKSRRPLRIAHAPTNRAIKGTDTIISILKNEPGIELDVIEGVSNLECLRRNARADVLIDQFILGPGVNALESALMGQAVICGGEAYVQDRYRDVVGYWPFTFATTDTLLDVVRQFRDDRKFLKAEAARAEAFVHEYHNRAKVAALLESHCQGAPMIDNFPLTLRRISNGSNSDYTSEHRRERRCSVRSSIGD